MKPYRYLIALFAIIIIFLGCGDDESVNPCDNIICANGASCINGECVCSEEWEGPLCAREKTPVKMSVGGIELTSFPETQANGASWDFLDGADVFIAISRENEVLYESGFVEDLSTNFTFTTNFEFSDPLATYTISVFDWDDGLTSSDFMGGISFTPYLRGLRFPVSYSVECEGCAVSFQFQEVSYFHD